MADTLTAAETQRRNYLRDNKPAAYEKVIKYSEKLKAGQSVAIIQFQYDYACNFRCQHCSISSFQHKKGSRSFTIPDARELSKQADELGLARFDVTGGEPLVFPDLDQLIEALDPSKFYIQSDTNGWLMTDEKAKHLKSIGIDRIQLSIDNLSAVEHDDFRRKRGSHERTLRAIDSILNAGLHIQIATVVTHQRAHSEEFLQFLEFAKNKGVAVSVVWPKPVGEWSGHFDVLASPDDIAYVKSLRSQYNVYDHLTPAYGLDIGCIAVKRMISITKFGDVMPCPWMHFSLGNFFEEPLKNILEKGMRYFKQNRRVCLVSESRDFIEKYVAKTYGKDLPVPIEEVMTEEWLL
jgi:MoaA/NifB/PqqE/SkfB family radical SAM enzyme